MSTDVLIPPTTNGTTKPAVAALSAAEANTIARQMYSRDPAVTTKAVAAAASRSDRWARSALAALRTEGDAVVSPAVETASVEPVAAAPDSLNVSGSAAPQSEQPKAKRKYTRRRKKAVVTPERSPLRTAFVVWSALVLGLGSSVAANVAAAAPSVGPRLAAAIAPLALLLTVEVLARVNWPVRGKVWRQLAVSVVALVSAVVSFNHQRSLLLRFGEPELIAAILPLAVDGLILIACLGLMTTKKEGKS